MNLGTFRDCNLAELRTTFYMDRNLLRLKMESGYCLHQTVFPDSSFIPSKLDNPRGTEKLKKRNSQMAEKEEDTVCVYRARSIINAPTHKTRKRKAWMLVVKETFLRRTKPAA